jgi:hypothetical protein
MDAILRHSLDFYVEQASAMLQTGQITGSQPGNAPARSDEIYAELCDIRGAIEKLSDGILYLNDLGFP